MDDGDDEEERRNEQPCGCAYYPWGQRYCWQHSPSNPANKPPEKKRRGS